MSQTKLVSRFSKRAITPNPRIAIAPNLRKAIAPNLRKAIAYFSTGDRLIHF
jgi:hypothetical protein